MIVVFIIIFIIAALSQIGSQIFKVFLIRPQTCFLLPSAVTILRTCARLPRSTFKRYNYS